MKDLSWNPFVRLFSPYVWFKNVSFQSLIYVWQLFREKCEIVNWPQWFLVLADFWLFIKTMHFYKFWIQDAEQNVKLFSNRICQSRKIRFPILKYCLLRWEFHLYNTSLHDTKPRDICMNMKNHDWNTVKSLLFVGR